MSGFAPDYRHFAEVMANRRPRRLPLYEHTVSVGVMEELLGIEFQGLASGDESDRRRFYDCYCRFFEKMTYDVVTFEVGLAPMLPGHGAIRGGMAGPIQSRNDFDAYPWDEVPATFRRRAFAQFDGLVEALPPGMKAVGGVGYGVFELSEDLVGLEYLPFMAADDPELYADLYERIGEMMTTVWGEFLERYAEHFVACRIGDDLGFRSSLLTHPRTVREHIVPQYRRLIDLVHAHGRPFLWHSCGCIFEIMEEMIATGIDAKHSNEDAVAPFERWIADYGERIALLGGFDMDFLCSRSADEVRETVVESGRRFRSLAQGYALGSGNSIPDYVPAENYRAMIEAAKQIREDED